MIPLVSKSPVLFTTEILLAKQMAVVVIDIALIRVHATYVTNFGVTLTFDKQ